MWIELEFGYEDREHRYLLRRSGAKYLIESTETGSTGIATETGARELAAETGSWNCYGDCELGLIAAETGS